MCIENLFVTQVQSCMTVLFHHMDVTKCDKSNCPMAVEFFPHDLLSHLVQRFNKDDLAFWHTNERMLVISLQGIEIYSIDLWIEPCQHPEAVLDLLLWFS